LRAFLFIFQSYPVLVFIARNYYRFVLARGKGAMEALFDFEERIFIGAFVCLVELFYAGISDLIMGRWRRGCFNLCLAVLSWVLLNLRTYASS
jgi:hypothetical protein